MKKSTLLFLMSLFPLHLISQNLVPNPSFEDTVACPVTQGEINNALGWSSYASTPDYFNPCSYPIVGVPNNFAGYQYAKSGNSYAGLISFSSLTKNFREFIGIKLTQTLIIGQKYYITFDVSMGLAYSLGIAINKIGARVFTNSFTTLNPTKVDNFSHVFSDSLISDTLNWLQINGSFIADSSYQYLCLGNFFSDSLLNIQIFDSSRFISYVYLDNVCLSDDSNLCSLISSVPATNQVELNELYPNPANDLIYIKVEKQTRIEVLNLIGKICLTTNSELNSILYPINVSTLPNGYYLVKIINTNKINCKKILIHHEN